MDAKIKAILECCLIEPNGISPVTVEFSSHRPEIAATEYRVIIRGQSPYFVVFTKRLLSSEIHEKYLSTEENIALCAINARNRRKGRKDLEDYEEIIIKKENWKDFQPRRINVDLTREEAESEIIKLLYIAAKEAFEPIHINDLKATLNIEKFNSIMVFLQKQGYLDPVRESDPLVVESLDDPFLRPWLDDSWTTTKEGFKYFEEQVKKQFEKKGIVPRTSPLITSRVVETAINDAENLLKSSGATSGVDRIHTALQGHLIAVCEKAGIKYGEDPSLTELFKLLRSQHPALQLTGPRSQDILKILNSSANILDALNPLRNKASVAHPNPDLLDEEEALLVINTAKTLLHYLDAKFSK